MDFSFFKSVRISDYQNLEFITDIIKIIYPACKPGKMLSLRNAGDSNEDVVKVENAAASSSQDIVSAMLASGFRQTSADARFAYFLPCPLGTFSNITSKGTDGCSPCPPGICILFKVLGYHLCYKRKHNT